MKKIILLLSILLIASHSWGATYYVANNPCSGNAGWGNGSNSNNGAKATPFLTVKYATSQMSSGDTVIIDDGTYGITSCINTDSTTIPEGTAGAYTTVRAENDGMVTISGINGTDDTLKLYGNDTVNGVTGGSASHDYIEIRGIIFTQSYSAGVKLAYVNHIKIVNCGVYNNGAGVVSFAFTGDRVKYVLFEGCYTWGSGGRYQIFFHESDRCIARNCVARLDGPIAVSSNEIGQYCAYSSTNIEIQNCIAIDADQFNYYGYQIGDNILGAFGAPTTVAVDTTGPINFTQCIALNNDLRFGSISQNAYNPDVHYNNCVGADIRPAQADGGTQARPLINAFGNTAVDNCTFVDIYSLLLPYNGWYLGYNSVDTATDTIWSTMSTGTVLYDLDTSTNNNNYSTGTLDGGGTSSTNTKTYNPETNGLEYLPRTETGSQLKADGIGANILYQFGATGSIWGEAGYNLLQDGTSGQGTVELWPYPNEDIIKTNMATYSYDSGNLSGARGFCASGTRLDGVHPITLTSYIWEYLGNEIPADIYGESPVYDAPTIAGPNDFSTTASSVEIEGTYTVDSELTVSTVTWALGEASGFCIAALGVFSCTVPVELGVNSIVFTVTDSNSGTANDSITVTRAPLDPDPIGRTYVDKAALHNLILH